MRIRILDLERDLPRLRIENHGQLTLAVRNNLHLAAAFYDGEERLHRKRSAVIGPVDRITPGGDSEQLTIILPRVSVELPLYRFYFDYGDAGMGETLPWPDGLANLPAGPHRLRLMSNGSGLTAIDQSGSLFRHNVVIPDLIFAVP